jgi:hypothetical protein
MQSHFSRKGYSADLATEHGDMSVKLASINTEKMQKMGPRRPYGMNTALATIRTSASEKVLGHKPRVRRSSKCQVRSDGQ